eukprot:TRINITY_DN43210_c0_g1_i1.p1 TRINITY_DN43210_c0_g1~~TRINITY_DN43210_c0_g1_i1.p1  ORF type:complete len:406 (+),score=129.27 TRINITY_DN43210_c0_g1_i1:35-1219(+)
MNVPPVTPLKDEEFYKDIVNSKISVENIEGKGKAMVAKKNIKEGGIILTDHALVVSQDLDDRLAGIPVCAHTMRSLETPSETFERVVGSRVPKLPRVNQFMMEDDIVPVRCAKGCPLQFVNEKIKAEADRKWHRVLCKGRMTSEQREAYETIEKTKWKQGGTDYSDSFHLILHAIARIICKAEQDGPAAAWYPYDILAWAMWDDLALEWATRKDAKRTPQEVLEAFSVLIFKTFGADACGNIGLSKEKISRLAGGLLLNAQERSPESPFGRYLAWLAEKEVPNDFVGGMYDWRADKPTDVSNEVYYSARAQGVYSTHAVTNHSCEPNAEVQYTEQMDEGLHMVATRNIEAGEEITISYILNPDGVGYVERQAYLANHYRFTCTCDRCLREKKLE